MYIALEGVKGSGKSTLIDKIYSILQKENISVELIAPTRIQDAFSFLELFSKIFNKLLKIDLWNLLLYAARSNKAAKKFKKNAKLYLGDRSIVTSYLVRWDKWQKPEKCINIVNILESSIPSPDHIIYLNVSLENALERIKARKNRFYGKHHESELFTKKSLENYQKIMTSKIERLQNTTWHIIDGNLEVEAVLKSVSEIIYQIIRMENK